MRIREQRVEGANRKKAKKMIDLNPNILVIILNVNGLNTPI